MSADNYYVIWKNGEEYLAYMRFASSEYPKGKPTSRIHHVANSIESMISWLQKQYAEYGYTFLNIEEQGREK